MLHFLALSPGEAKPLVDQVEPKRAIVSEKTPFETSEPLTRRNPPIY